jgi:uncharacterized RDD family membrane protein YckC
MTEKLDTLQKIEIAEGVEIQLRLAGPVARGLAFLTDSVIKFGIYLILFLLTSVAGGVVAAAFGTEIGSGVGTGLLWIGFFVLDWGYSIGFEVSGWNATPGKRMAGLRVARTSGAPITWNQAVVRNLLRVVDVLPVGGVFGAASCLSSRRFQRLGDLAADTVVIHAEAPRRTADGVEGPGAVPEWRPPVPLTREEQAALLEFADRRGEWAEERQTELAALVRDVTQARGGDGVRRILGMARWIRTQG